MTQKNKQEPRDSVAPETVRELAPIEWARELGHEKTYGRGRQARKLLSPEYATANAYYGWDKQAHHWGADSLKLSEKDFRAALDAAAKFPTVPLYAPAISKVIAERYRDFKPLKPHKER